MKDMPLILSKTLKNASPRQLPFLQYPKFSFYGRASESRWLSVDFPVVPDIDSLKGIGEDLHLIDIVSFQKRFQHRSSVDRLLLLIEIGDLPIRPLEPQDIAGRHIQIGADIIRSVQSYPSHDPASDVAIGVFDFRDKFIGPFDFQKL